MTTRRQTTVSEEQFSAVKIHDEGASSFEEQYARKDSFETSFRYGRRLINEHLHAIYGSLPPDGHVLDVGCGTGVYVEDALRRGLDAEGVEPADAMFDIATKRLPAGRIKRGTVSLLPYPDQTFDLVYSIEVFRYLNHQDNIDGLKEVLRVLKPGGVYFGTYVNRFALDGFHLYYRGKQAWYRAAGRKVPYHTEFETPASIDSMLRAVGFSEVETSGALFAPLRIAYKLGAGGPTLAKLVSRMEPVLGSSPVMKGFLGHLMCIARR